MKSAFLTSLLIGAALLVTPKSRAISIPAERIPYQAAAAQLGSLSIWAEDCYVFSGGNLYYDGMAYAFETSYSFLIVYDRIPSSTLFYQIQSAIYYYMFQIAYSPGNDPDAVAGALDGFSLALIIIEPNVADEGF